MMCVIYDAIMCSVFVVSCALYGVCCVLCCGVCVVLFVYCGNCNVFLCCVDATMYE